MSDKKKEVWPSSALLLEARGAIIDTWIRNLTFDTAMPIIGHILLGMALDDKELSKEKHYAVIEDAQHNTNTKVEIRCRAVPWQSPVNMLNLSVIDQALKCIRSTVVELLEQYDIQVVGRSMRLTFIQTSGRSPELTGMLYWMQVPKTKEGNKNEKR